VQEPTRADAELMDVFDGVLGVLNLKAGEHAVAAAGGDEARINELVAARTTARASKNWPEADRIRKELDALGVVVTDSPAGPTWSRQARL
jgi:cysteinyl-tRNA synthetase